MRFAHAKVCIFSNNLLSVRCRRIAFDRVFAYNKGAKYYFCWRSRIWKECLAWRCLWSCFWALPADWALRRMQETRIMKRRIMMIIPLRIMCRWILPFMVYVENMIENMITIGISSLCPHRLRWMCSSLLIVQMQMETGACICTSMTAMAIARN